MLSPQKILKRNSNTLPMKSKWKSTEFTFTAVQVKTDLLRSWKQLRLLISASKSAEKWVIPWKFSISVVDIPPVISTKLSLQLLRKQLLIPLDTKLSLNQADTSHLTLAICLPVFWPRELSTRNLASMSTILFTTLSTAFSWTVYLLKMISNNFTLLLMETPSKKPNLQRAHSSAWHVMVLMLSLTTSLCPQISRLETGYALVVWVVTPMDLRAPSTEWRAQLVSSSGTHQLVFKSTRNHLSESQNKLSHL